MNTDKKHIRALVKNTLCAVTVVVVHIQNSDALAPTGQQSFSRNRSVIQKAITAHEVRTGMVAWGPGSAKHTALAARHQHRSRCSSIGTSFDRVPCARCQRRTVVH